MKTREARNVPWMSNDGVGTAVDDFVTTIGLNTHGWLEELV